MEPGSSPGRFRGVAAALIAAALFGASTPAAKALLGGVHPTILAGVFYLGSGVALATWGALRGRLRRHQPEAPLRRRDLGWLGGAILAGGIVGPVLLMLGLRNTPAAAGSLLLNLEGVLTAALAWFVFRESFDRRIFAGMACILAGGAVLSWSGRIPGTLPWASLAIVGACLAWAVDNNLTRRISGSDPVQIASLKGLVAGPVTILLGLAAGAPLPSTSFLAVGAIAGVIGYGLSLTLFISAMRHIGAARTAAYFSVAPFVGAGLSVVFLGDGVTLQLVVAGLLMGTGVWLHLTEHHEHEHGHEPMEHEHAHAHDGHHDHAHAPDMVREGSHSHWHQHAPVVHSHSHYPDIHHRHLHK
ncbi:MAG TPA: DMT family transporter [Thermoanaerobaculaceae bacterium]|nr:DMT family transporter [Thermoanaerobaculaceae bacterium]